MWQSKNDRDLERDVREELAFDPRVATKTITASAKDGVVTLSGSVPTFAMKVAAHHDAERVNGVVVEHIDVSLPDTHARSDALPDIVALVEGADWPSLQDVVLYEIQKTAGVTQTDTHIVFE
jgi:hypothetical protein